jgi:hypothetical protein
MSDDYAIVRLAERFQDPSQIEEKNQLLGLGSGSDIKQKIENIFPSIRWEYQVDGPRQIIYGVLNLEALQLEISFEYEHYYEALKQVNWIGLGIGKNSNVHDARWIIKQLAEALAGTAWDLQNMCFL